MSKVAQQISVLDALKPPAGQRLKAAVLTTYDLDLGYLEGTVLPTIVGVDMAGADLESSPGGWSDTLLELRSRLRQSEIFVLADKRRFDFSAAKRLETYDLLFAESYAAFHPKLFLMAFEQDFRLVVASANITEPGFHTNLEVLWMASTEQGDRFGQAASGALGFLEAVTQREWPAHQRLKKLLKTLRTRVPKQGGRAVLLHSESRRSIAEQWKHVIGKQRRIEEIHVVSPFFDQGGRLKLLDHFGKSGVHLYLTEQVHGAERQYRLPISKDVLDQLRPECMAIDKRWMNGMPEGSKSGKTVPSLRSRILHAKLYAVRSGEKGWALLGSPNFTCRAMLAPAKQRNAEAAIGLAGGWNQIKRILPAANSISLEKVMSCPAEEDEVDASWVPFLTSAEYNVADGILRLNFSARPAACSWTISYETKRLVGGGKGRYPATKVLKFKLGANPFLVVREGKHQACFPIGVADKEMLPELPGMDSLGYETILELLADGVDNLKRLKGRIESKQSIPDPIKTSAVTVSHMEKLSRFTKAMESLRKRLINPLTTTAEASALFDGDLGINRLINGLDQDDKLDAELRHFFFLELKALLASIRWVGVKESRARALQLCRSTLRDLRKRIKRSERRLKPFRIMLRRVGKLYGKHGAKGWHRA